MKRAPWEDCDEDCEHGHYGCAVVEGGTCEAERTAGLCAVCEEREGEWSEEAGEVLCSRCIEEEREAQERVARLEADTGLCVECDERVGDFERVDGNFICEVCYVTI